MYTALELVTNAFYTSGIRSEILDNVSGGEITLGLRLLNTVLSLQNISGRMIPYFSTYVLTPAIGQEINFIPYLLEVEALTFDLDSVRFSTQEQQRQRYFGTARANNIESLPLTWHLERTLGGSNIYLYFKPNKVYPINIIGKFGLTMATLEEDLSVIYEQYYIDYLIYKLAQRLCGAYNVTFSPDNKEILSEYENNMKDISQIDLSMKKISTLQKRTGYSYADVNLGRGFEPPR